MSLCFFHIYANTNITRHFNFAYGWGSKSHFFPMEINFFFMYVLAIPVSSSANQGTIFFYVFWLVCWIIGFPFPYSSWYQAQIFYFYMVNNLEFVTCLFTFSDILYLPRFFKIFLLFYSNFSQSTAVGRQGWKERGADNLWAPAQWQILVSCLSQCPAKRAETSILKIIVYEGDALGTGSGKSQAKMWVRWRHSLSLVQWGALKYEWHHRVCPTLKQEAFWTCKSVRR